MLKTQPKTDSVELVLHWMLASGIQSDEGGYYAWYDLENKNYSFLYSEITGYAIITLLFLHTLYKDEILLDKAKRAAHWIIKCALHDSGGVRTRLYKDDKNADKTHSFSGGNLFTFDTAMVLYSMVNLYKYTDEQEFLTASKKIAQFLIEHVKSCGSIIPLLNVQTGKNLELRDKWSGQSGAFHAKVCLGLLELSGVTKDIRYRDVAEAICEHTLTYQQEGGRFITDRFKDTTNLHPHCYAAEGLLYAGLLLKKERFVQAAKKATQWLFQHLNSEGLSELYDATRGTFNNFQRSDILAQALRLGLIFNEERKHIEDLKSVLLRYQYLGEDSQAKGGFFYSHDRPHINSWCTMFAVQALCFYQNISLITENKPINLFI